MINMNITHLFKNTSKFSIKYLSQFPVMKTFARKLTLDSQSQSNKLTIPADTKLLFYKGDQKEQELIKIKQNLFLSLKPIGVEVLNYDKIYENLMSLIKTSSNLTNLDEYLLIFLEKNIQMFSLEQMIQIFGELGKNNIGSIAAFSAFQYHIAKKLISAKSKVFYNSTRTPKKIEENTKFSHLLYYYFSILSELSMMEETNLNFVLEFFANNSESLLTQDMEENSIKNLYNFIWYTSLSIASILEKTSNKDLGVLFMKEYVGDRDRPVMNEKGARSLMKILKFADEVVKNDLSKSNFTENTPLKVRLYKSLYYLKLDGLELGENLEKFLTDFKPFYQLNMETSIKNSALENNFENILKTFNLNFEKEKKLSTCSVDFYINPLICIEVNGPQHYVFKSLLPVARDLLKKRSLALENYDYVGIHYNFLLNPKKLIPLLNERLKHLIGNEFDQSISNAVNEVAELKKSSKERDVEIAGEKLERRLKNSKYLV